MTSRLITIRAHITGTMRQSIRKRERWFHIIPQEDYTLWHGNYLPPL
jgi:hypothetical protein